MKTVTTICLTLFFLAGGCNLSLAQTLPQPGSPLNPYTVTPEPDGTYTARPLFQDLNKPPMSRGGLGNPLVITPKPDGSVDLNYRYDFDFGSGHDSSDDGDDD